MTYWLKNPNNKIYKSKETNMAIAKMKVYRQVKTGIKQAVIYASWDIGLQKSQIVGKPASVNPQVIIAFEVLETDDNGNRMAINKRYNLYLSAKANLRKDIEGLLGREMTKKELEGFDTNTLVGMDCMINIITDKNGKSVISNVMKLMEGLQPMKAQHTTAMPEWVQKIKDKAVDSNDVGDAQEPEGVVEVNF